MKLTLPELADGEIYAGAIGDALGNLYHVILLPGDNDGDTHEAQLEWAKSIGGELPTRVEQALMFATARDAFQERAYWSCETDEDASGWAWYQNFYDGTQDNDHQGTRLRARAVRRLPI